jgi:hypothetical protein
MDYWIFGQIAIEPYSSHINNCKDSDNVVKSVDIHMIANKVRFATDVRDCKLESWLQSVRLWRVGGIKLTHADTL